MTSDLRHGDGWLPPGLAQLFEIVLDAAAEQRDLSLTDRDAFFGVGSAACEAGASLSELIETYLTGAGQLWEQVFASATAGQALDVGRALRRVSETAVGALAEGFEAAQRNSIRAQEATRRDLIDDLLAGTCDATTFHDRAADVGFPSAASYVVAVADSDREISDTGPIHARMEHELKQRAPLRRLLTFTKGGQLVVVAPDADPAELGLLREVLQAVAPIHWRAGVGERCSGVNGISRSFRQAIDAIRLSRLFELDNFVHFDGLLPFRMMVADRAVAEAMVDAVVVPLVDAPRGSLIETLETFIDAGANMAEVARRMSLGPRTVAYRLDRIAALTGHSPRDPVGRLTLELAMRCRPLAAPDSS